MKYVKQYNILLVKKTNTTHVWINKTGRELPNRILNKTAWVVNHIYKKQLVFDVFEKWKSIYFGIPWFRK